MPEFGVCKLSETTGDSGPNNFGARIWSKLGSQHPQAEGRPQTVGVCKRVNFVPARGIRL